MSHDELLARMNLYTVCDRPTKPGMICDNEHLKESYPEWFALRAVVELAGKLQDQNPFHEDAGWNAGYNHAMYEVIQAIEKELN